MKTRALTEGALMTALTVIAAVISYYIPLMTILLYFLPIPAVILSMRQGLKTAAISSVASVLLLLLFIDPFNAITMGSIVIIPGLALGWCYQKKKSGAYRLVAGFFAYLFCLFLTLYLSELVSGISFVQDYTNSLKAASETMTSVYSETGLFSEDELSSLTSQLDSMVNMVKLLMPAVFLLAAFFMSWITNLVCDFILRKLRIPYVALVPFYQWRMPNSLRLFLCILMLLMMLADTVAPESLQSYTFTIQFICMAIFVLMGYSFIDWWSRIILKRGGKAVRIISVVLIFIFPMMLTIMLFVGITDAFFPIRELILSRRNKGS